MSPPTRTLEPDAARSKAASTPTATKDDGRPDHAMLQALQQTAGNQAVAAMVQREPNDKPKARGEFALGQTVASPGAPPPTSFDKNAPLQGQAVPVDDAEVRAAYAKDPSKVIRSPSYHWHVQMYHFDKGTAGIPMAFKVGDQIAVHPDHDVPATPMPQYSGKEGHGLTPPAPPKAETPAQPPPSRNPPPAAPSVAAYSVAPGAPSVAPGGPSVAPGPGPAPTNADPALAPTAVPGQATPDKPHPYAHWAKATPITEKDAADYYKINPKNVIRSPNQEWHENIYDLDKGEGKAPKVFQVGNQIVVAPDYKGPATDLPHITAGPVPMPQAGKTIGLPGTVYDEKSKGKSYSSVVTENAGQTQIRDRKRELGVVTTGQETTDGELSNRKEQQKGVGFGVGGNVVGGVVGTSETSKAGDNLSTTNAKQLTGGVTGKGELQIGGQANKEFVYGTKPDGTPLAKSSQTNAALTLDPTKGAVGGNLGHTRTGPTGRQTNVAGGFTADNKGNSSVSGTGGVTSKGGHGVSVSVSAGHTVTAEDPEEVQPGVWEVRYVVSDTQSVGGGGTVKAPGGVGVGVSGSVTDADMKTGSRQFKDEKEAKKFKENAAERLVKDGSFGFFPVTTIMGALSIPIGEARGVGSSRTKAGSASLTFGATIGKSGQTTKGDEMSIRRVGPSTIHVTATVSASEGSDWSISGGLTNEKGSSESTLYAVTYEFDLYSKEGGPAFERFVKFPLPPLSGGRRVSVRTLASQEDHDKYSMLGGNSSWSGTTWQDKVEDDQGEHKKYGGKQSRDQTPGRFWKALGDKELHSNAQIVRSQENSQDAGARAEFTVSGESGEFNREEFGKIFMGAKHSGDAKASGSWKLSAQVPMARIRELEEVHPKLRNATGMDEKMKIYSELVKENGARMLGGQVGMSSKTWNLELKGDENFPGEKGRARLNGLRKTLMEGLKTAPDAAGSAISQATEELDKLKKRREAVADMKKYTDLPDGLRKQQLGVIDQHMDEFKKVLREAQSIAMKHDPNAKAADVATKLKKDNYDLEHKKADREYKKLQDQVQVMETKIVSLRKEVRFQSIALGDVIGHKGSTALKFSVDSQAAQIAIGMAKGWINQATAADKQQAALDPKIDGARNAWTDAKDQPGRVSAIKELASLLSERAKLMGQTIHYIREAGKAVFPITTKNAMSHHAEFWLSLGMVEDEPAQATPRTSMAL